MKRSSVAQVEEPPLSDYGCIMKEDSFGLKKCIPVLSRGCWLTATKVKKVLKRTSTSILEMIVWVTNMIEIRVTLAILNLLGPFLFVFDIFRNIIHITIDMGQTICLNFQKFKITKIYSEVTVLLENTKMYFRDAEVDRTSFITIFELNPFLQS